MRRLVIWAVSDGRAGMENQALGIAEALQRRLPASIDVKRIQVDKRAERLPEMFWGNPFDRLLPTSAKLEPPWPDVWIACGRRTIPFTKALKSHCFTVQTQNPPAKADHFGLVVPPVHDVLSGTGVVPIQGSPNRLTKERLKIESQLLRMSLPSSLRLEDKFAVALIGGPSKDFRWNEKVEAAIMSQLAQALDAGHAILATLSRRTPPGFAAKLQARFRRSKFWLWDGEPVGPLDNPYFGLLGMADRILVTEESANMITEAAFTGKPVHLLRLQGGGTKWKRFHEALQKHGVLKPNLTVRDNWAYAPLRETDRVAGDIVKRLILRGIIDPLT